MSEDAEGGTEFVFTPVEYPNIDGIPVEEARRAWLLSFLLHCGKGGASAKAMVDHARELETYLIGQGAEAPRLKAVK